jgi:hypothetical protein
VTDKTTESRFIAAPAYGIHGGVIGHRRVCSCREPKPHYHDGDEVVFGCWPDQRSGMGEAL